MVWLSLFVKISMVNSYAFRDSRQYLLFSEVELYMFANFVDKFLC